MKVASIVGFCFCLIGLVYLVIVVSNILSNSSDYSLESQTESSSFWPWFLFGLSVVLSSFFFFGFVKLGEKTDTKLLKNSSWMVIGGVIFSALMILVIMLSVKSFVNSYNDPIGNYGEDFSDLQIQGGMDLGSSDNFGFTGNAIIGGSQNILGVSNFVFILFSLGLLFAFVSIVLFYVGLVEIYPEIKFSRIGAIFGILGISSGFLVLGFATSLIFILLGVNNFGMILFVTTPIILLVLNVFFMSMSLWHASKKFEVSPGISSVSLEKKSVVEKTIQTK